MSPRCPLCKTKGVQLSEHMWRCNGCDVYFDEDPDEGSDYSDRDPSWRLQRQEHEERRRRNPDAGEACDERS